MPPENDPTPPGDGTGEGDPPSGGTPPVSFTQEQLTHFSSKERERGTRAGRQAVLDKLGFKTVEEMESFVTATRDAERQQMTEAERIRTDAEATKAAAEAERAAAARDRQITLVERALLVGGAPPERTARMAEMVALEPGIDSEAITAAVVAFKAEFPGMFSAPAPPASEPANGGPPGTRSTTLNALERGQAMAKARLAGRQRPGAPAA